MPQSNSELQRSPNIVSPQAHRRSKSSLISPSTPNTSVSITPKRSLSVRVGNNSNNNIASPIKEKDSPISSRPSSQSKQQRGGSIYATKRLSIQSLNSSNQSSPISSVRSSPKSPSRKQFISDINNIKVISRFRPENSNERIKSSNNNNSIVKVIDDTSILFKNELFTYDRVFGPESTQNDVFQYSVLETVDDFLNGYNGTVLAYGQTGSGKTFTMMGDLIDESLKGIIPRITDHIFKKISKSDSNIEFTLSASYMEIYMEQIRDLLTDVKIGNQQPNLQVHEDKLNGIHVTNLTKAYIGSSKEIYEILGKGSELRVTSSTEMNQESSRSHAIFQLNLTQENLEFGIKRSKLFLVDLAGSEKIGKTGVTGQNLEEAKKINSSLSSLGNVINALTDPKSQHIPYRDSKLTRILQESLGGNSRTSLIINCSPSSYNEIETLSTLRFGTRAKRIKNKAHINTEPSTKDLLKQIDTLKKINENNTLHSKELEYELELWKTGVKSIEEVDNDSVNIDEFDTINESKNQDLSFDSNTVKSLKEATLKIEHLWTRIAFYTDILAKAPDLKSPGIDSNLLKQFEQSQIVNEALMIDLTDKCEKLVTMNLQIDELESKLYNNKDNGSKILALEKSLLHLNAKLEELEIQNNLLRKEISTTKKIADTRNERIDTLELILKDQQIQLSKENYNITNKLTFFKNKLSTNKRSSSESSSNTIPRIFLENNNDLSMASNPFNGNNYSYNNNRVDRFDQEIDYSDIIHMRHQTQRSNNHLQRIPSFANSTSSNGSNKVGFNLHIVKPIRGGSSSTNTVDQV
ncbi:hypothetical protein WICMUC_002338 [Wickerhamomyces mucosus]|uniref:Kinesin-like protein n=1 Tax=Wickerhamomyces mucosus TaxID=1378264 RepID=A0A9P8PQ58_9ASCO|nr:hypothetical protein WICMUC_002338 [Wickerhamomyces mucosus]